jgi:hypothetical protein
MCFGGDFLPERKTGNRREFIRWLAESQRQRSIAVARDFDISPEWIRDPILQQSVHSWSLKEIGLAYEPRSLAVSPAGDQVAVGSKSGDVYIARWDEEAGKWLHVHEEAFEVRNGTGVQQQYSPGSIRGVLFLGRRAVVAGWGNGGFSIIPHPRGMDSRIESIPEPPARKPPDWFLGTQRITRLVPLWDSEKEPPDTGDLVLGIMSRGDLCVLRRDAAGRFSSGWLDDPTPHWGAAVGHLADALWANGRLWLLTTRGRLLSCTPGPGSAVNLAESREVLQLTSPQPYTVFRKLAACELGLAVLVPGSVTFLWFPSAGEDWSLEPAGQESPQWFPVSGAIECGACIPYPVAQGLDELGPSPVKRWNRVWTVLSTAEPGLRWVGWKQPEQGMRDAEPPPFPSSATGNFAVAGGRNVLYVGFGRTGPQRVPFLACATRDHKLLIASILDRRACAAELSHQISWLLANSGDAENTEEVQRIFSESPGMAWHSLMVKIKSSLGALDKREPWALQEKIEISRLLSFTERNNLLDLAARLVYWHQAGDRPQAEKDLELAYWTLHLLRRATEISPRVAQEVAEVLFERLQRLWNQGLDEECKLLSISNFLRKWVIHGPTYGEKRTQLYEVYRANETCGRKLDALVYLTRLVRARVDILWEADLPTKNWTPTVWSVVAGSGGQFAVTSLSDGGFCAVNGEGQPIPWLPAPHFDPRGAGLTLSEDRRRLEHMDAGSFMSVYRHGPYARSLWLQESADDGSHLLVFCIKGWLSSGLRRKDERGPTLYALHFRPVRVNGAPDGIITALRIESAVHTPSHSELYSIYGLEDRVEGSRTVYTLLAGTTGQWEHEGGSQPTPFVEIDVSLAGEKVEIGARAPSFIRVRKGERSILDQPVAPEAAKNQCWSLARSEAPGGGVWIWAGFQDGSIRGYQRRHDESGATWKEGGWQEGEEPRRRGLKVTGAVWRLLSFAGPDGKRMLAYGTGDGVAGAVAIKDLEKQEASDPFRFLFHFRGDSPIGGLLAYQDGGQQFLLSIHQRGTVCIFSLSPTPKRESVALVPDLDNRGYRFAFPGLRVDQFHLNLPVRAITPFGGTREPGLLLATETRLHACELRYPSYSQRRRDVRMIFQTLLENDGGGRSVQSIVPPTPVRGGNGRQGLEETYRWLRVLVVGDMSLSRFSLWYELRKIGDRLKDTDNASRDEGFREYRGVLERLIEETYRRRPFSEDLALALWEEASRISSWIARRILGATGGGEALAEEALEPWLGYYLEINSLCADLCNRWIGVDQSLQSVVLIDSFTTLFDWTALCLLASDSLTGEKAWQIREFMVYGLIQHRLNFPDSSVPFETLRVLNVAITRAVVNMSAGVIPPRSLRIRPVSSPQDPRRSSQIGFFDVMTLVGDVWERLSGSLSYADPLTTEITRFFSLSLLLLPDCALITGQVVSESQLSKTGLSLARLILDQARALRGELGLPETPPLLAGLDRFEAYIGEKADLTIIEDHSPELETLPREDPRWGWRFLLQQAKELPYKEGEDSDAGFLAELKHVLQAAAWLAQLGRSNLAGDVTPEHAGAGIRDTVHWLNHDKKPARFFSHSRDYLRKLDVLREEVLRDAGLTRGRAATGADKREIDRAIKKCELCLRDLEGEHLFRPQRDHYEQVILAWRDQLVSKAGEAVIVLELMDRFNRHVYRRSADALLDNILNLALQTAPISYADRSGMEPGASEPTLRNRILQRLEGYPLISRVFESGEYLVQNTHLAGALLTIARQYAGTVETPESWNTHETVNFEDIQEITGEVARRTGLSSRLAGRRPTSGFERVPGTRAVWDVIIQECARNIEKHSWANPQETAGQELALKLRLKKQEKTAAILLSSNVPYALSLGIPQREELAGKTLQEANEGLARFFEPGERGGTEQPGAGMGLFMVERLTDLWAMKVRLLLLDMDMETEDDMEDGVESLPLCLKISWEIP